MPSIAGKIITHEKEFIGTIEYDSVNGLITSVKEGINKDAALYNTQDCLIFPGFGDIHIHAREDVSGKHCYKEDFLSASAAAINGGVTHVADMPNNPIPPIDDKSYEDKKVLTKKAPIQITIYAGIGPNTSPLSKPVPYKAFMGPSIGELFFRTNEELEEVIKRYAGENVSFHCEDPIILEVSKTEPTHEDRRPLKAEILATDFALYLIEKYNLTGKLCHYSSGEGLQKIIAAKKRGVKVTCEVTPTHLFFDRSVLTEENHKWFQMNPPLRYEADKTILLQAFKDGWIDFLATDHAPHSIEEKLKGISGISQLDTYALFVTHLIKNEHVSLQRIAETCAYKPGEFVNRYLPKQFGKGFGKIEEGYSANFTILNLAKPTTFKKEMVKSKSGWSPFENHTFPGSIEAVYFNGIILSRE
ncbi:MAG: amidohydrolase family protein [Leptospiraceae bacterium]|nr:amidohydrolase family protein [Leptospiraceae bacterium]